MASLLHGINLSLAYMLGLVSGIENLRGLRKN